MFSPTVSELQRVADFLTAFFLSVESKAIYDLYGEYGLKEGIVTP